MCAMNRGMGVLFGALLLIYAAGAGCGSGEGEAKEEKETVAKADSTKTDSTEAGEKKKKAPEGVPVKVSAVETGDISSYMLFSATVEAEETVDVYAQATGLVERVLAEEGDRVQAGQALVKLADDDLKLAEAEARVQFRKLESQFRRTEEVFSRKLLSNEEYERQKFDLEQARIRWERARLALDHASVRAPVNGVVAERMVKLGDRITPSSNLFKLVNMNSLIARVYVPGREMRTLAEGQPAVVTTDFIPGEKFGGRILRISPVVDPGSGTFKVTVALDTGQNGLRPGMFVNTHIVTATHTDAVLVPKRALVYDDGLPHVFVVEDSTAHRIRLTVAEAFQNNEHLEVLEGIKQGDRIVVVGQNGLKDKARVRVIEGEGLRIPAKADSTAQQERTS